MKGREGWEYDEEGDSCLVKVYREGNGGCESRKPGKKGRAKKEVFFKKKKSMTPRKSVAKKNKLEGAERISQGNKKKKTTLAIGKKRKRASKKKTPSFQKNHLTNSKKEKGKKKEQHLKGGKKGG